MTEAWIPVWIIGGPFLGLLFLSALYKGGTTASSARNEGSLPRTPGLSTQGREPSMHGHETPRGYARHPDERHPDVGLISRLSGPVAPGAITRLSGPVSPGAIATLSRWRPPGAIAKLSAYKSPGAISRLSGYKSPGAISRLSASRPAGAISSLSAHFFVSNLFGLPLLTRSQAPLEPDDTLLKSDR